MFALYKLFASDAEREEMAARYRAGGLGYGEVKKALFEKFEAYFAPFRKKREELQKNLDHVEAVLRKGAERARAEARQDAEEGPPGRGAGVDQTSDPASEHPLHTMASQEEYKVQLEVFEGPLDLLLYLIKKDELDIYDIPIERITTQYMEYLDLMRMLDLNIAGEFIVMAATLMMIKSRMLLPVEERAELEEEEEDDPRWDLVRQLVEYKKFKDAAMHLEGLEERQVDVFGRGSDAATLGPAGDVSLHDVSIFDLISAFNDVLKKVKTEELKEIFAERYTVAEKIDAIVNMIKTQRPDIVFEPVHQCRVAARDRLHVPGRSRADPAETDCCAAGQVVWRNLDRESRGVRSSHERCGSTA